MTATFAFGGASFSLQWRLQPTPDSRCATVSHDFGDNGAMPMVPSGFVHQGQLAGDIKSAIPRLGPEVVHVSYSVGPDSTGDPSLFFRIVLQDSAIREDTIADLTANIATVLFDSVRPIENWGLRPYFNFRSKSEQDRRRDPEWA
jgi:hypothetical protein